MIDETHAMWVGVVFLVVMAVLCLARAVAAVDVGSALLGLVLFLAALGWSALLRAFNGAPAEGDR